MNPPPFDQLWFQLTVGLITGLCLGSFITMLSYRLPRQLSIVTPGSHCISCKAQLRSIDLVPILSWLIMRGRCRHCGAKIGGRYVLIELLTGIACASAFGWCGFQLMLLWVVMVIIFFVTSIIIIVEHEPFNGVHTP